MSPLKAAINVCVVDSQLPPVAGIVMAAWLMHAGGDCDPNYHGIPTTCCSGYPSGDFDPMCVFDYCLKKLSPL